MPLVGLRISPQLHPINIAPPREFKDFISSGALQSTQTELCSRSFTLDIGRNKSEDAEQFVFCHERGEYKGNHEAPAVKMNEQENSTVDGLRVRGSGAWAEEKLYYLRRYLDIFSQGMKNKWGGRLYYVDLFSGPGRCRVRGTEKEFDGSPLIALTDFDFAKYYFFESDPACFHALDMRTKARAPDKLEQLQIFQGDCSDAIEDASLPSEGLGVAFIDPTGISQIPFETVRKLTAGRKIDLIINFPEGMGIRMNLRQYTQTDTNALSRFMGSDRWKTRYDSSLTSFDQVCSQIAKEYLANLGALGYLAVDSDWIPVRSDKNALLYYLLFASKNPRGNDFWRKIKQIGPYGQRELSWG